MSDKTMTVGRLRALLAKCPDELPLFLADPQGAHYDCDVDVVKDPNGPDGATDWILKVCLKPTGENTDHAAVVATLPKPATTQPELPGTGSAA